MKKIFAFLLYPLILSSSVTAQIFFTEFTENFEEQTSLPLGWTQEYTKIVIDPVDWRIEEGGYTLNPGNPLSKKPPVAYSGSNNLLFQVESFDQDATILITPKITGLKDFSIVPELRFWHVQDGWKHGATEYNDDLKVYYKTGKDSTWKLLEHYTTEVTNWTERIIPLPLEDLSENYYLGFEGISNYGWGVGIDSIVIVETGIVQKSVDSIFLSHPVTYAVANGTVRNPIARTDFRVSGNSGTLILDSIVFSSKNTIDSDIDSARLWITEDSLFFNPVQIGSTNNFSGGEIVFDNLNYDLELGYNSIWLTFSVNGDAEHGNITDVYLDAASINIADSVYLSESIDPDGQRVINQKVFFDDFSAENGWSLYGEFERARPLGLGGSDGRPDPLFSISDSLVLGTDLTGLGAYPGDYEKDLPDTGNIAVSPTFDFTYYNTVELRFFRYLNIDNSDRAAIDISVDNGETWQQIWYNLGLIGERNWDLFRTDISHLVDRTAGVKIRFRLGNSDAVRQYSGWNIDNFTIIGNFVEKDAGATLWVNPKDACSQGQETVQVYVHNFGGKAITEEFPVGFSLDNGATYTQNMFTNLPLAIGDSALFTFTDKADLSDPKIYYVKAKTFLPGDEENSNDELDTIVYSFPYLDLPYSNSFEDNEGVWKNHGKKNVFTYDIIKGLTINSAYSGNFAWATYAGVQYQNTDTSYLESPCFNFTGKEIVIFDAYLNYLTFEGEDGTALQYSLDEGATWSLVNNTDYTFNWNWYNNDTINSLGKGWSGNSNGWVRTRHILPSNTYGQPNVKFRYIFASDSTGTTEGIAIDDIKVYEAPHDIGIISIDSLQTDCQFANDDKIWVSAKNFGLRALPAADTLIMGLKLNSDTIIYDTLQIGRVWPVGDTLAFRFTKSAPIYDAGIYELNAFTLIEQDPFFYSSTSNDTASFTFSVLPNPVTNLPDSVFSAFPDTLFLTARYDENYSYLWGTGETVNSFDVPAEGTYTLITTDSGGNGCITYDTIAVETLIPDIGIDSLLSPLSDCALGTSELLTVQVRNFGTDTMHIGRQLIAGFTYLTFTEIDTFELTQTLPPSGTYAYTFSDISIDMSNIGTYNFTAWTTNFLDSISGNDTLITNVDVYGFPNVNIGTDTVVKSTSFPLDAGPGFTSYLWNDSSINQGYTADTSGIHWVTVHDENGCPDTDSIHVFLKVRDLQPIKMVTPVTQCDYESPAYVRVRIENIGTDTIPAGYRIPLVYELNNLPLVRDTFDMPNILYPGQNEVATFLEPVSDIPDTTYSFKIYISLNEDLIHSNDTLTDTVYFYSPPAISLGNDTVVKGLSYLVTFNQEPATSYTWNTGIHNDSLLVTNTGTYWVQAVDYNNCVSNDTISVILVYPDMGITATASDQSSCNKTASESITAMLRNFGTDTLKTGDSIAIGYQYNDIQIDEFVVFAEDLLPQDSIAYTFTQTADFSQKGEYQVKLFTGYSFDLDNTNDTLLFTVGNYEVPVVHLEAEDIITDTAFTLDAGYGENWLYAWQDGSADQTFTANRSGTYSVTVTHALGGCSAEDDIFLYFLINDLSVTEVNLPATICDRDGIVTTMKVTNSGNTNPGSGTKLMLGVMLGGELLHEQEFSLTSIMGAGSEREFTFSEPLLYQPAADPSTLKFFVNWLEDVRPGNDTLVVSNTIKPSPDINLGGGDDDTLGIELFPYNFILNAGYASYLWQDGSQASSYLAQESGWYKVDVSASNGCVTRDSVFLQIGTGIYQFTANNGPLVKVYPNPAENILNVEFIIKNAGHYHLRLLDMTGKIVFSQNYEAHSEVKDAIDLSALPRGMYILTLQGETGRYLQQIILQ